jgi:hypothetical protein
MKRVTEDRTVKGAQVAPVAGKRKRNVEDTPGDERPTKKRGTLPSTKRTRNTNVNVRLVLDENGVPRKLRRKVPLRKFYLCIKSSCGLPHYLSTMNTNPNLIVPSYDTQLFEFGLKSLMWPHTSYVPTNCPQPSRCGACSIVSMLIVFSTNARIRGWFCGLVRQ